MAGSVRRAVLVAFFFLPPSGDVVADAPAQAAAAFARAQVAIAGRDCEAALPHLAEAVAAAPGYWEAHRSMGECFLALNKPDEARRPLEAALRIKPDDAATRALLARVTDLQKAETELMARAIQARDRRANQPPPAGAKPTRPLGDYARVNPPPGAKAGASDVVREKMRARATSIFRPRMVTVAQALKALLAADRRYRLTCGAQGAAASGLLTHGSADPIGQYTSERAWKSRFQTDTTRRTDETPACRALHTEIRDRASKVAAAMDGVDAELASPPSVDPAIREEVWARLKSELW